MAAPENSGALPRLHGLLAGRFGPSLDRWTAGADWLPHTTLLYRPDGDLDAAFVPFTAHISQIEFSEVREEGYAILRRMALSDPEGPAEAGT